MKPEHIQKVKVIEEHLRRTYRKQFKRSNWFTGATLRAALRKLTRMKFFTGFPFGIQNASDSDQFYSHYPDTGKSFWSSWLNASRLTHRRRLLEQNHYEFLVSKVNAYYTPGANRVTTLATMIYPPLFFVNGTSAHNYGSFAQVSVHRGEECGRTASLGNQNWVPHSRTTRHSR